MEENRVKHMLAIPENLRPSGRRAEERDLEAEAEGQEAARAAQNQHLMSEFALSLLHRRAAFRYILYFQHVPRAKCSTES